MYWLQLTIIHNTLATTKFLKQEIICKFSVLKLILIESENE